MRLKLSRHPAQERSQAWGLGGGAQEAWDPGAFPRSRHRRVKKGKAPSLQLGISAATAWPNAVGWRLENISGQRPLTPDPAFCQTYQWIRHFKGCFLKAFLEQGYGTEVSDSSAPCTSHLHAPRQDALPVRLGTIPTTCQHLSWVTALALALRWDPLVLNSSLSPCHRRLSLEGAGWGSQTQQASCHF